jgi:hypothetical protein
VQAYYDGAEALVDVVHTIALWHAGTHGSATPDIGESRWKRIGRAERKGGRLVVAA